MTKTDCRSHQGLRIPITKENFASFKGQYTTNGERTVRIDDNLDRMIGNTAIIRSPLFCCFETACDVCLGDELAQQRREHPEMFERKLPNDALSFIQRCSMKHMHNKGGQTTMFDLKHDIGYFLERLVNTMQYPLVFMKVTQEKGYFQSIVDDIDSQLMELRKENDRIITKEEIADFVKQSVETLNNALFVEQTQSPHASCFSDQEKQVIDLLKEQPGLTINQIKDALSIKYDRANSVVMKLMKNNIVTREDRIRPSGIGSGYKYFLVQEQGKTQDQESKTLQAFIVSDLNMKIQLALSYIPAAMQAMLNRGALNPEEAQYIYNVLQRPDQMTKFITSLIDTFGMNQVTDFQIYDFVSRKLFHALNVYRQSITNSLNILHSTQPVPPIGNFDSEEKTTTILETISTQLDDIKKILSQVVLALNVRK